MKTQHTKIHAVKVLLREKLTAWIREIRKSKTIEEISGTQIWFFEEVNNINKLLLDQSKQSRRGGAGNERGSSLSTIRDKEDCEPPYAN